MSTPTPLKILMLTSSYPRNDSDNSSIFLRYLASSLVQQQVNVHVLAPDHLLVDNIELDPGIKNHWFHYLPRKWQRLAYGSGILPNLRRNRLLYLQVPFFLTAMFFSLFFLCKRIRPDIIHAHWVVPQGFIAIIVGKLLNIPVIATAHGGDAFSLNTSILSRLKAFTLKHCHAWTSNTQATASACGSNLPKPVIIPMGVDVQHFQTGKAENITADETKKIILFVGRLVEKKGVKYLIEAFSKMPSNLQEKTVLWVIGDGDERSSLEKQAQHVGIKNIKFWGQVENDQLADFYAAASIFIAPSIIDSNGDTEGQGVILLEAMASKTPIIASSVGGISEVITHNKTGILVQPNSPNQLSHSIRNLLNNNDLSSKLSENAYQKVLSTYNWHIIAQQLISILNTSKAPDSTYRSGFSATRNRTNKAKK